MAPHFCGFKPQGVQCKTVEDVSINFEEYECRTLWFKSSWCVQKAQYPNGDPRNSTNIIRNYKPIKVVFNEPLMSNGSPKKMNIYEGSIWSLKNKL